MFSCLNNFEWRSVSPSKRMKHFIRESTSRQASLLQTQSAINHFHI